ncbi:MAG TPA: PAS domain S-box protein [Methanoregula sp.]|nr:PAS domain S-box protein [Methanoregula sp.]
MFSVLYVDDEPALIEITRLYLEKDGEFSVDTATSGAAALALLGEKTYDAIISDYQMPVMDGIEFLKRVRAAGNPIPFIIFTGRGREEVVMQALNEGADFYLQKGGHPRAQFAELSNKVRYAILRRRAEDSLRQEEAQLRQIIDLVPHMIFAKDRDGNYILANRAVAEGYNTTVSGLEGKPHALFHKDSAELRHMLADDREVMDTGVVKFIPEEPYIDAFGKRHYLQTTKVPFTTAGNGRQAVLGVAIDITERKRIEEELLKKNEELQESFEKLAASDEELRSTLDEQARQERALRESEERYRNVVEDQTEFISRFLPDGTHVFVNGAYCRYFGLDREKLLGHRFKPEIPAEDRERVGLFFASLTPDTPVGTIEHRIVMPGGSIRWQRWSDRAIFGPSGALLEYQSVGRDITEEKATEDALRESGEKYRSTLDAFTDAVSIVDRDFVLVYANRSLREWARSLGIADEIIGRPVLAAFPFLAHSVLDEYRTVFSTGTATVTEESSMVGGVRIETETRKIPLYENGRIVAVIAIIRDITKRKDAELALRESEERYRSLFSNATLGIFHSTPDGRFIDMNPALARMLGYSSPEEAVSSITDIPTQVYAEPPRYDEVAAAVLGSGGVTSTENLYRRKDGGRWYGKLNLRLVFGEGGKPDRYEGFVEDITGRKEAEDRLRESGERFRMVFDTAQSALIVMETDPAGMPGRIIDANATALTQLGITREELLARGFLSLDAEEYRAMVARHIAGLSAGKHGTYESVRVRKDGGRVPVEVNVHLMTLNGREVIVSSARDISSRKATEETLRMANKKLSLLSGITRHDIGNQITVLQGYLTLLENEEPCAARAEYLREAATAARRISAMIQFTREYEAIGASAPAWQDCRALVAAAAQQAGAGNVRVENAIPEGTEIFADPMIVKVFYNLIENAVRYGEKITRVRFSVKEAGQDLILVCEDDGCGIPDGEKERIFDRGFGKNTGLGLALSREILDITGIRIRENGGPGKGARFEMAVPAGAWREG